MKLEDFRRLRAVEPSLTPEPVTLALPLEADSPEPGAPRLSRSEPEPGSWEAPTETERATASGLVDAIKRAREAKLPEPGHPGRRASGAGYHLKITSRHFEILDGGTDAELKFGKHRGFKASEVWASDPSYLRWIQGKGEAGGFPRSLLDAIDCVTSGVKLL